MKDTRRVMITHLPIEKDRDEVFGIVKRSRLLINSICQYSKDLRKRGVKVFERKANIIRTEAGYFCAFYDEDLREIKNTKPKKELKPFKGQDGRMKVALFDKEGEIIVEDLAMLTAKTFLPNPDGLSFVKFKDENPENCKLDNLYWSNF